MFLVLLIDFMRKVMIVFVVAVGLLLSSCGSRSVLLLDHNCVYEYDRAHNVYRLIWSFKAENKPSAPTDSTAVSIHHSE